MLLLLLAGAVLSFYLFYSDVINVPAICPTNGCATVASSKYSRFLGIPVSLWGLIYYSAFSVIFFIKDKLKDRFDLFFKFFLLAGIGFTVYLRYLEFFVIKAVCIWCWGSVLIVILLLILYLLSIRKQSVDENKLETTY